MNKTNEDAAIEDIARHSLDCIEKVGTDAENVHDWRAPIEWVHR